VRRHACFWRAGQGWGRAVRLPRLERALAAFARSDSTISRIQLATADFARAVGDGVLGAATEPERAQRMAVALRSIEPGEEIRFDYSTTMIQDHWTMECRCGQPTCRRVILDFHHLPPITQNRYLQLGIVQRFVVNEVRRRSPARRVVRRTRAFRQVSF